MEDLESLAFIKVLPTALLVLDNDHRVLVASPACAAVLGRASEQLRGEALADLVRLPPTWPALGTSEVAPLSARTLDGRGIQIRTVQARHKRVVVWLATLELPPERTHDSTWNKAVDASVRSALRVAPLSCTYNSNVSPRAQMGALLEVEALDPETRADVCAAIVRALDPQGSGTLDIVFTRDDEAGRRRLHAWAQTRFEPASGSGSPKPLRTRGALLDVTERQSLAIALQHNRERLELATVAAEVGVFDRIILPHGATPYWSPSMRALLGYGVDTPADPEWFFDRVLPRYRPRMMTAVEHANEPNGDGRVEVEVGWLHPDGGERRLLIRSLTLFSEDDSAEPTRSIGVVLDVSAQHRVEEQRRLRSMVLEATPDLVAITDRHGTPVYINAAAREFIGGAADAEVSATQLRANLLPDAATRNLHGVRRAVRDGAWSGERTLRRHDGIDVPISMVLLAHRDSATRVSHIALVARDLSREKRLEAQFLQSQKMEAIGRLAGGVAHDFNNLLSVILGSCELALLDIPPGSALTAELDNVVSAGKQAAGLTRQLLAFGRKQIMRPTVLDANAVIVDLKPMLRRLVDETIDVRVVTHPEALHVKVDRNQLEQILLNLVVNARDAMSNGGVLTLETFVSVFDSDRVVPGVDMAPGNYAVIAVSDTGHGMDEDTRRRIFDPFFTTKAPGQGTGLGLSTVFGIVRQSGGGIWVYSEPGQGTTFKVYFPLTGDSLSLQVEARPRVATLERGTVLVVEDNEPLRAMVVRALRRSGLDLLHAGAPTEALDLLATHGGSVDLLLTDVLMPGMTGKQLAERVTAARPEVTVLYMSGYTENSIVHHGVLDAGVHFLPKPVTPARLIATVHGLLRDAREGNGGGTD